MIPSRAYLITALMLATTLSPLVPASAQAPAAPPAAPAAPAAPAVAAPVLPPPTPLQQAFLTAATALFDSAKVPDGTKVDLLIDPLIDGNTGAQSIATRSLEAQIRQLVRTRYANKFEIKPFTSDNVAKNPLVFIGTFTAINASSQAAASQPRDAYRVCFAMLDLKTKLILSKGFARATTAGINAAPTPAFADSPVWLKDPAVDGYVRTCQGTKAGDPINAAYVDRIGVAAVISDAIIAYDARKYAEALALYTRAKALPGGDQLRVHNGIYLSNWKLNRRVEAERAFGDVVDYGLKSDKVSVLMLFRTGRTDFVADRGISAPYPIWVKTIAQKVAAKNACLEIVGHTSRTGAEPKNDALSVRRAETIKAQLARQSPALAKLLKTNGVGWRENLIGTGKDDRTDALDRRVEFKSATGCV